MVNYSIYSLLYKMSLMTSHLRMQKHTYQNIRISYTHFLHNKRAASEESALS
uniref:Uncharacterized protein n=1 Tax=Siphoviridae sp. ctEkS11 TaxID=2827272 RepID=A0A8S5R4X2_9CAUD|nr:MAG TPA: hypothetical protein [Siphoviridae sp. ctEkS11]